MHFQALDTNGDGVITRDEFEAGCAGKSPILANLNTLVDSLKGTVATGAPWPGDNYRDTLSEEDRWEEDLPQRSFTDKHLSRDLQRRQSRGGSVGGATGGCQCGAGRLVEAV